MPLVFSEMLNFKLKNSLIIIKLTHSFVFFRLLNNEVKTSHLKFQMCLWFVDYMLTIIGLCCVLRVCKCTELSYLFKFGQFDQTIQYR